MAFRDSASSHPNPSVLSDHDPPPASNAAELTNLRERATALLRSCPQAPDEATQGVLLAAVKHLPLDGRVTLMREIVLLGEDWDALRQLGRFIIDAVLKPMRLQRVQHDPYSRDSDICFSRALEIALESEDLMSLSKSSSGIRQPGLLKELCLRRDGFRCVLSGHMDQNSLRQGRIPQADREPRSTGSTRIISEITDRIHRNNVCVARCAHIIPLELQRLDEDSELEMERKATIWWALFRYLPDLRGAITPDTVDRAENAITLESVLQACIDAFDCSLEPLDEGENMYRFRNFSIIEFPYLPETFKLRSRDPAVPLPRRELLGAHFVVGSILYESGLDRRMFDFLESDHHELMCEIAGEHGWSGMVAGLERKVLAWM